MSSTKSFKYTPLNKDTLEIRLLTIFPGEEWSPIQCGLQTTTLPRPGTPDESYSTSLYSALSYAWGRPQNRRSITLEGKIITVREALWTALFYLRSTTEKITIWIDALCIDQENIQERNSQVARMGLIYGAAENVIVWLGLPSEESYAGLTVLRGKAVDDEGDSMRETKDREEDWRGVEDLCSRPYWKRLWIIQEVIRAVKITIQCGTAVISWEEFSTGLLNLKSKIPKSNKDNIDRLQTVLRLIHHRIQYHQTGSGLIQLLETFGDSTCFDPRDKIYGLLGLANDCENEAVVADYDKTVEQVFEDVVGFYYLQSLELEVSNMMGMNWRCPGMIRFAKLLRSLLFVDEEEKSEEVDDGSRGGGGGGSGAREEQDAVFHFVGFFTGVVGLLGPTLQSVTDSQQERASLLATWYYALRPQSADEQSQVYESLKESLDSLYGLDTSNTQRVQSIEKSNSNATIGPRAQEAISAPNSETPSASQLTGTGQVNLGSPRLALIQRKKASWISLVPADTQINDIVATFHTSDVVVILRPLGGVHCRMLGTAVLIPCIRDKLGSNRINEYGSGGEEIAFHVDVKTLRAMVS